MFANIMSTVAAVGSLATLAAVGYIAHRLVKAKKELERELARLQESVVKARKSAAQTLDKAYFALKGVMDV